MGKEGNTENKKRFMFVNFSIRSENHVAFLLRSPSAFSRYIFGLVFVLCFLKFVLSFSN